MGVVRSGCPPRGITFGAAHQVTSLLDPPPPLWGMVPVQSWARLNADAKVSVTSEKQMTLSRSTCGEQSARRCLCLPAGTPPPPFVQAPPVNRQLLCLWRCLAIEQWKVQQ